METIARAWSRSLLSDCPQSVPKDMKLILCIGQSNMVGRAKKEGDDGEIVANAPTRRMANGENYGQRIKNRSRGPSGEGSVFNAFAVSR